MYIIYLFNLFIAVSSSRTVGDTEDELKNMGGHIQSSHKLIYLFIYLFVYLFIVVSSSRTVGDTEDELKNMGGHIQSSHKLLTKYGRREWTDRLLILLALAFFFASVLYIVKKRLFPASDDDSAV